MTNKLLEEIIGNWRKRIANCKVGGKKMSIIRFCKEYGINYYTFHRIGRVNYNPTIDMLEKIENAITEAEKCTKQNRGRKKKQQ